MKKNYIFFSLLFISIGIYAQSSFSSASMIQARSGHTLTSLSYQKVIAVGGYDQTKNLKTAELYNSSNNTWTMLDSMQFVRYTHSANLIKDDSVIIVLGGWDGGTVNYSSTEIYNMNSNKWRMGPTMSVGRSGHTSTTLPDGRVVIIGGFTGTVNTTLVEIYNPTTNTISTFGNLATGRSYHTATFIDDNKILVCGGYNPDAGFQLSSAEILDLNNNTITAAPNMSFARDYHSGIKLNSGKVLVTGGREFVGNGFIGIKSVEVYNPATNTWESKNDMPGGQSYHEMFDVRLSVNYDADIILVGGVDTSGNLGLDSAATYFYNSDGDYWEKYETLKTSSYEMRGARFVPQADWEGLLITGGTDNSTELISWDVYQSVKKKDFLNFIFIYPNPSTDFIQIENLNKEATISFIATDGRLVKQVNNTNEIAINDLPKGIYTLKIITDKELYTQKLVIE